MSESSEGSLPIAVGDYVAVHARMSCVSAGVPHDDTHHRGCAYSAEMVGMTSSSGVKGGDGVTS